MADGAAARTWVGVNYWSRTGGPRMWTRYDGRVVRAELAVLAEHHVNVTRSFCYWPDFVPSPEHLDEDVIARYADFLDAHSELGLGTIPTFIVGHMSAQNWDPSWRVGRDLYRDVWLVSQQAWFAAEIARRFGGHPAVVGWLVSNEMPLYGGPAQVEEITAWARILVQAVRSAGATQPISTGDGAWGVEISGIDNGYSLRALAPLVDFVGPHVYPTNDDPVRQAFTAAFVCELCGSFGRPVVLEEFGVSSDLVSGANAAHYYRQVLHSTLLAGAHGWLAWNNCDFDDLFDEDPYRHHGYEMHFGLIDRQGRPKPQLSELARFSRLVSQLEAGGFAKVDAEVLLVVPEHFEGGFSFISSETLTDVRANLLQSYIAAREADLPVGLARERDGIPGGARLYMLPCAKLATAPGAARLRSLAEAGATVYASYFAGSTASRRGPWFPWLEEIFGVRHQLRYGLVDPIEEDEIVLEFVAPFEELALGTKLSFSVEGSASARAYLPVEPKDAEVLAVDQHGRPALLLRRVGAGHTVLCTYPLEHMAACTPRVNPENTWRLYAMLASLAGVSRPVAVEDGRVVVGRLATGDGETVLVINTSPDTVQARLSGAGARALAVHPTGSAAGIRPSLAESLVLPPFEVAVLEGEGKRTRTRT
jgi:endo-1,4-beta-mannosidase